VTATTEHVDAIVIGAGLAGLTAAHQLSRTRRVALVEARTRVGGRAHSVPAGGGVIEAGATWFWANEPVIRAAATDLGLEIYSQDIEGDALFETADGGAQRLGGNPIDGPAFRLAGGAQRLAEALAAQLPAGTLRLGSPAASVTFAADGLEVEVAGRPLRAAQGILAVPPALAVEQLSFRPDLPASMRESARRVPVWMAGMIKAIAVYDADFWHPQGLAGAAISYAGPFREFHDHSGPEGSPAAIFGFAPAENFAHADSEEIAAAFRGQLVRLFGDEAAHPRELHVTDWSRERYTQPAAAPASARGSFGGPEFHAPVHERLYWATTETAPAFGGHMEGALLAGLSAAERVERALVNSR